MKKKAPTPPASTASPDTGSTPAPDQRPMVSDKWGIGHSVSGVMPNGEKFSGEVFGYDEATGLVTVRAPGNIGGTHDVRIIKAEACTDVKSIPPKTPAKTDGAMPAVDDTRSKKREEENIKAAQARAGESPDPSRRPARARKQTLHFSTLDPRVVPSLTVAPSPIAANIGVGVTQEAQDIFDALARTLPCRWADRDIVVMDEVVIGAPYSTCAGVAGGDPRAVERVQKVLANEKKKLGL